MNEYQNMSMLETAEYLMAKKKTPQTFRKIAKEVGELLRMTEEEVEAVLGQFYADLTLSGKFVNVGGDKWDLKYRQKFEVASLQFQYDDEATIADLEEEEENEEDEDEEYDGPSEDPDDFIEEDVDL